MGVAERIVLPVNRPDAHGIRHGEVPVHGGALPIAMAGDGPPVILLHGWTLDWRMWLPQVADLAQEFTLVMPDRRGFGRASAPPDLEREAEDVDAIARYLGTDRYALLGLSQGAAVAIDCARRQTSSVTGLIVSGAPVPALVPRDEVIDVAHFRALAKVGDMAGVRAAWSRHPLMRHRNAASAGLLEQILAAYQGRDLLAPSALPSVSRDALARLPMPVLSLTGANDSAWRRECARELAAIVPHGEHALIEGAGHLSNIDQPARFNSLVSDFLRRRGHAARTN